MLILGIVECKMNVLPTHLLNYSYLHCVCFHKYMNTCSLLFILPFLLLFFLLVLSCLSSSSSSHLSHVGYYHNMVYKDFVKRYQSIAPDALERMRSRPHEMTEVLYVLYVLYDMYVCIASALSSCTKSMMKHGCL